MSWYPPPPPDLARHYRWWTVSASRSHLKLGPIALTWYRWPWRETWHLELCVLLRGVWRLR